MTVFDPQALLEALTQELTCAGWTRQADPAPAPGTGHVTHRLLASPDAAAHVHATAYRVSGDLQTTLYGPGPLGHDRARTRRADTSAWRADTAALAPSVLIHAARAAAEPAGLWAPARLIQAGWEFAGCQYEGSRLLEQRWASPDQARTASFYPADQFDSGGWLITRPDQRYPTAQLDASAQTPSAVIAALALAD
jgi:hypothetical protein